MKRGCKIIIIYPSSDTLLKHRRKTHLLKKLLKTLKDFSKNEYIQKSTAFLSKITN